MGMVIIADSVRSVSKDNGLPPAKSGAGGNGLLGEPPYCDDGVPGRGVPLMSAGSYGTVDAGGRAYSFESRAGDRDLVGDCEARDDGRYVAYSGFGACMFVGRISGALSNTDGSLDSGREAREGWYDRAGEAGLVVLVGASSLLSALFLKRTLAVLDFGLLLDSELSTSWSRLLRSLPAAGLATGAG